MRKLILVALCAMAVIACKKDPVGATGDLTPSSTTGEVVFLSSTTAVVSARSNKGAIMTYTEQGIFLSEDPDVRAHYIHQTYASNDDSSFSITFIGLTPSTTYYYQSFLYYDTFSGIRKVYGEVKSFTTPAS